jgi:hypothetical protein
MLINKFTSLDVDYMNKEHCPFNVNELETQMSEFLLLDERRQL